MPGAYPNQFMTGMPGMGMGGMPGMGMGMMPNQFATNMNPMMMGGGFCGMGGMGGMGGMPSMGGNMGQYATSYNPPMQ